MPSVPLTRNCEVKTEREVVDQLMENKTKNQSGFQSGLETSPLAAVIAGYCNAMSHFKLEVVLSYVFLKMFFTKNS